MLSVLTLIKRNVAFHKLYVTCRVDSVKVRSASAAQDQTQQ